jgi:hypothetical protein
MQTASADFLEPWRHTLNLDERVLSKKGVDNAARADNITDRNVQVVVILS